MATLTSTSTTQPNELILPYLRDILTEGRSVYENTPYTPYPYPRVTPLSPDQMAGMDLTRGSVGNWSPYLDAATSRAGGVGDMASMIAAKYGGGGFQPTYDRVQSPMVSSQVVGAQQFPNADVTKYMNPYESLVTGAAVRSMQDAVDRQRANANARFAAGGAFGGSRQGLYESNLDSQAARGIGELVNQSRMQNYTNAQSMFTQDANRLLQADGLTAQLAAQVGTANAERIVRAMMANQTAGLDAQRLGLQGDQLGLSALGLGLNAANSLANYGTSASTLAGNDAARMLGIGSLDRSVGQANLDWAYKDFQEERDYPWAQLGRYSSILNGNPLNRTGTTTTNQPGPNEWSQIIGAGLGIGGILGQSGLLKNWFGGSNSSDPGGMIVGGGGSDFGLLGGADAGGDWLGLGDAADYNWGYM